MDGVRALQDSLNYKTQMNVSIFGMGYVGCATGACLAQIGHNVIGVEPNETKVSLINRGISPIVEKGIDSLLKEMVGCKRFHATSNWMEAIAATEMAMISVGTPSRPNGSIDLLYLTRVAEQVGSALATKTDYFTVVIRSTVLPGTVEDVVIPELERTSGKKAGKDFGVCMNPEFLREGTSIDDFYDPPKTVIGQLDGRSGEALVKLYDGISGPVVHVPLRVAEMVKYVDNSFHALKVAFANEVGNLCKVLAIDSHKVMDIFCLDTKLNLSPYYLKPGFAFGGSCLPKDLRALNYEARSRDLDLPVLSSILESNRRQVYRVAHKLLEYKGQKIAILGLSFKGGTDDLRESPTVELVEFALGKGFTIGIFDRHVALAKLFGANKEFITNQIPHISTLLSNSLTDLINASSVIVVANRDEAFRDALLKYGQGKTIIDLVRLFADQPNLESEANYYGVCW